MAGRKLRANPPPKKTGPEPAEDDREGRLGTLSEAGELTVHGFRFREDITFEQWKNAGITLRALWEKIPFAIGDWLLFGEQRFPEEFSSVLDAYANETLRDYQFVCKQIPFERRRDLPMSHHRAVAGLPPDVQDELLETAEREGWRRDRLRAEAMSRKPPDRVRRRPGPIIDLTPEPAGEVEPPPPEQRQRREEPPPPPPRAHLELLSSEEGRQSLQETIREPHDTMILPPSRRHRDTDELAVYLDSLVRAGTLGSKVMILEAVKQILAERKRLLHVVDAARRAVQYGEGGAALQVAVEESGEFDD